jgi:hypothetical protein
MKRLMFRTGLLAFGLVAVLGFFARAARAVDYYYEPRSFYVTPPLYGFTYPVLGRAPIMVYEPAPPPVAPVVGYYEVLPAPVARVKEHGYSTPLRSRYRYKVEYPNGLEYKFRYKRDGGYVRYSDQWGH